MVLHAVKIGVGDSIRLVEYDPGWPRIFAELSKLISGALGGLQVTVEHVGSTSIPGAASKPIIDMDLVLRSAEDLQTAIELLARIGYRHVGDLGITGREAFESPSGHLAHHLYAVVQGSSEHTRHLRFRDYLRNHPEETRRYSALKKSLATKFSDDREAYTEAKSAFVEEILRKATAAEAGES